MKLNKLLIALFIGSILFTSCSSDDDGNLPRGDYDRGILISGEGSGAGTGSISFVSNDLSTTENLIYKKVNNAELGVFLQSLAFDDERAFIIVDNASTITVVDRFTFEELGKIATGLDVPRYMTIADNKGYVTNWGSTASATDDFIAVINLETFSVESTIAISNGPERIIAENGKLYVSHKGAFTTNNIISIIDIATNTIEEVIVKDNPDELFFNTTGDLVVLSEGRTLFDASFNVIGHTLGAISTIDVNTLAVISELEFADAEHPSLMVLDGSTIYYALNGAIYTMPESASALPATSIISSTGFLYGMEVENDLAYTLNASFTDVSKLNVYSLNTNQITFSTDVALGASKIYFN